MRNVIVIAVLFAASSCMSMRPAETAIDENKFQDIFGDVPIIQCGMSERDVDRLVGGHFGSGMSSGSAATMMWFHDCGLCIDTSGAKVVDCRYPDHIIIPGPGQKETITDSVLATLLHPGLNPKEVAEKIGPPSCGFCTKPGTVNLLYRQPGIGIVFVDEKLAEWRRVITYKDEPLPKE